MLVMEVLLACLILLIPTCSPLQPLSFKEGKFKVAQFTDLHYGEDEFTPWGPIQDKNSDHVMHTVLREEKPDFVLFTGDVLTGNNIGGNATAYWKYLVSPCVQTETPWAHVFGNHDDLSQTHGDRLTLAKYDMSYRNLSHTKIGQSFLTGISNYYLPIYNEKLSKVSAMIYVLDSGGGNIPIQITSTQETWLRATYESNVLMYGHVPSLLAFHIPTPDFQQLYKSGDCVGELVDEIEEMPNEHLFQTIRSIPDILLVTTGHYHRNDFCCPTTDSSQYFCQGRHSGYGGYSTVARGSRIVEFGESGLSSWIRIENGTKKDLVSLNLPQQVTNLSEDTLY